LDGDLLDFPFELGDLDHSLYQAEETYPHVMLITDFVNLGSLEGSLHHDELSREIMASAEKLDYIIVKNSLGTSIGREGYFKVSKKYLKENLNMKYFSIIAQNGLINGIK
jgi:hypothetical protein